jgi:hypothetical protein
MVGTRIRIPAVLAAMAAMAVVVFKHGKPREVTDDWYAQDRRGNVTSTTCAASAT